ncbi:uncharacterized protein [Anolis sagrei]|uniref:uncharacterized protein n=1 Tax=Anolis sagrei TaxID=38937 RepID=UPI00351FF892
MIYHRQDFNISFQDTLSAEVKDEEAAKPDSFSSDANDDKAQKDVPVQHAEAQEAAQYTWISADNHEYKQLERRAFSTLDLVSPTARDDSSLQENLVAPTASDDSSLQEDLISPTARDDSSLEEDLISPTARDDSSPQEDLIPPTARDDSSLEEDLISPIASDDNNLREVSYASDDSENAFAPMSDRAFDDGYAGNDPEEHQCKADADSEFADDSLENVLASVDIENEPLTPIA